MSWNAERIEILKKMWADGYSASRIAAELGGGVTRSGVCGKVHRLGLSQGRTIRTPQQRKPRAPRAAQNYRPSRLLAGNGNFRFEARGSIAAVEATAREPVEIVIPFEQRKTLLQLTERTCRWPVGDPGSGDFFFCGGNAIEGRPYCACHHRLAYEPFDQQRNAKHVRFLERIA